MNALTTKTTEKYHKGHKEIITNYELRMTNEIQKLAH